MIDVIGLPFSNEWAPLVIALDLIVKSTALLAVAFVIHLALGRRRTLVRSALWNACLIGLLLVPASSLLLPDLRISIPTVRQPPPALAAAPGARIATHMPDNHFIDKSFLLHEQIEARRTDSAVPFSVDEAPTDQHRQWATVSASRGLGLDVSGLILGVYAVVLIVLSARLAASLAAVDRLRRRSEPIENPEWTNALERWRTRLKITRRIEIFTSKHVSVPVVVGWFRPSILVPKRLATLTERPLMDAILLHELGHVRRGDYGWNLVRSIVQILYWPHPLTWFLGRIIGAVREQACDGYCVHIMGGSMEYRSTLLEVASGLVQRPDPALGLAMARRSNLGRRLTWIDRSQGVSRCLLRWPGRFALLGAVILAAGLLGSIELRRAKAQEKSDEPPAASAKPPKPADPPQAIEIIVVGKDTGKPLNGATVRASIDFDRVEKKTDHDGIARFDLTGRSPLNSISLDVWADGYVQQRHFFSQESARAPKIPERATIRLWPGEDTLGGTVKDEQGQPIAGVKVEIWGYLGGKKDEHETAYMVDATTDEHGHWRCRSFRDMQFAYLYLSHPDYLNDGSSHPRRHGSPDPALPAKPDDQPMEPLRDFTDVQVMKKGVAIAGTVLDEQGKPVPGAEVGWLEAEDRNTFHNELPITTTDVEGRFQFPHVWPGPLVIQVKAPGHGPALKSVEAEPDSGPVVITLGAPRTISGRIVDSAGAPIAGVFVNLDTWRGYRSLGIQSWTDAEGRFRWDDVPPDLVLISAYHKKYIRVIMQRAPADQDEIVLTLRRVLSIRGRVLDAETGEPIKTKTAQVEVGSPDPKTGEIVWSEDRFAKVFSGTLQADLDAESQPSYQLRIKAKGYEPFESRTFRSDEGEVEYDVKLTSTDEPQGVPVSGVVHRPDGTPLKGAEVVVTYPVQAQSRLPHLQLENGLIQLFPDRTIAKTDARGQFSLTREPDPKGQYFAVVVVHPDAFARVDRAAFEADSTIIAKPWGRIEGVARVGSRPASGAPIRYYGDNLANPDIPHISISGTTTADAEGRFVLDRVVPGDVRVTRAYGEGAKMTAWSNGTLVEVQPGETSRAVVGGKGRPVIARIARPDGFDPDADYTRYSEFQIQTDKPMIPYDKGVLAQKDETARRDWGRQWWASAEGHAERRTFFRYNQAKLQTDGTIRAEDVPPGDYRLELTYSADPIYVRGNSPERIAYATKQFTIPEIPGGQSDEPFDLGVLRPKPRQTLQVGQAAPAFDVESLSGGRITLNDFRGKYLLIDFWATWCAPCVAEIPNLKAIHDRFGKDERFAMLSLSIDLGKGSPRAFVKENGITWPQGFLGYEVEGGVQESYHVTGVPATFLIGPDGKVIARELRGEAIGTAVEQALNAP